MKKYFIYALCIAIIIVVLFPFLNVILKSLMTNVQSLTTEVIPNPVSAEGYQEILGSGKLFLPFVRTMVIAVISTVLTTTILVLGSFAMSRKEFKHKKLLAFLLFFELTIPGTALMSSRFVLFANIGLLNTYLSLIIAGLVSAYSLLLLQSYMEKIPESLIEMTIVSGGKLKDVIFDIVIPITRPGIILVALLAFVGKYNMYQEPVLFITDPNMTTLQVALQQIIGVSETSSNMVYPNAQMAAIIITLSVILLVLPFMNKYYVKGMVDGGVK